MLNFDDKERGEIFLEHYSKLGTVNLSRRHHSNVKLFVSLVFLVGASLSLWNYYNRTKLSSIVTLDVGKIQGVVITESGVDAEYFLGIPFAEAPVGKNRFEKTVPIKPWTDIKTTIRRKPYCAPLLIKGSPSDFSEDCLYLNVVRPNKQSNELLPVLFSIHGGAFELGGADLYGLSVNRGLSLIKHDVILVAIQYRLAVFGFASTGDKELPGNLGYFDQAEALSFIHRNIEAFGGDPKRITIIGCSAGGASVTALSISPYTRDFVHQAIAMSGSAFSAWATNDVVVDNTRDLMRVLGRKHNETTKERLKRATLEEIYIAVRTIGTTHFGENFGVFMPRLDGDFFPKDLPELIEEAPKKSIVIGLTSEESLAWTLIPSQNRTTSTLVIPDSKIPTFSVNDLEGLIREYLVIDKFFKNETKNVQDKILAFYSKSNSIENDNVFYLQRYTQILSDLQFNVGVLWEILLRGFNGWKVFAYQSPYIDQSAIPSRCPVKEAYHGTDQNYANVILDGEDTNDSDIGSKLEKISIKWLVNYIKTGNPSSPEFKWESTDRDSPLRYAEFSPNPQLKEGFLVERAVFWTKLTQDYNYNLVRMMAKRQNLNM